MLQGLKKGTTLQNETYQIEEVLGHGSFGITYRAVHVRLKKKIAIKEFFMGEVNSRKDDGTTVEGSTGSVFTDYRRKFRKEAENLARLRHDNIVNVSDIFDENGTTYYVMDFIDGSNLDKYINEKGYLSEEEAIAITIEIGNALEYMHSKKLLHLDIKPSNIMRGADGKSYLIDFGLSKQFSKDGRPEETTSIGLGTPGYAPIEQSTFKHDGTFPATLDVYALGATLYKMLTGKRPPEATYILNEEFPIKDLAKAKVSGHTVKALRKAMMPIYKNRCKSISLFLSELIEISEEQYKDNEENTEVWSSYKDHYKSNSQTENKKSNDEKGRDTDRKFHEINESYAHRKRKESLNIESANKEGRKRIINKNLKKASLYFLIAIVLGLWLWGPKTCNSNIDQPANAEYRPSDTLAIVETTPLIDQKEYGAPLSEGEVEDGLGGFDDNAIGYFSKFADSYITSNGDIYFDGYFIDDEGKYPISLKFEIDDDKWIPEICYYHNINYNTKLKMSVRFTEEQMIITGNAAGSRFIIKLNPTTDGKWEGSAQNGNHKLRAYINPVAMP